MLFTTWDAEERRIGRRRGRGRGRGKGRGRGRGRGKGRGQRHWRYITRFSGWIVWTLLLLSCIGASPSLLLSLRVTSVIASSASDCLRLLSSTHSRALFWLWFPLLCSFSIVSSGDRDFSLSLSLCSRLRLSRCPLCGSLRLPSNGPGLSRDSPPCPHRFPHVDRSPPPWHPNL